VASAWCSCATNYLAVAAAVTAWHGTRVATLFSDWCSHAIFAHSQRFFSRQAVKFLLISESMLLSLLLRYYYYVNEIRTGWRHLLCTGHACALYRSFDCMTSVITYSGWGNIQCPMIEAWGVVSSTCRTCCAGHCYLCNVLELLDPTDEILSPPAEVPAQCAPAARRTARREHVAGWFADIRSVSGNFLPSDLSVQQCSTDGNSSSMLGMQTRS
jgi:hypothetical protein